MTKHPLLVTTLGTAGGPAWWKDGSGGARTGISTAVTVGEAIYLFDFGLDSARQLNKAGIDLRSVRAGFITHLHSDHVVDLPHLMLFGLYEFTEAPAQPMRIFGPGQRSGPPPRHPLAPAGLQPVFPENPTPRTESMVRQLLGAYATDLNERVLDSLRVSPLDIFHAQDIELSGSPEPQLVPPDMDPFTVYEDELVRVSAILVEHPPVWPAFAFRIDAEDGSVVISGDTAPTPNLVRLAQGADLLLHEAIDPAHLQRTYPGDDPVSRASREHHAKAHTTPADAGHQAQAAGVGLLALHHLVPGHSARAVWAKASQHFDGPVLLPADLSTISVGGKA